MNNPRLIELEATLRHDLFEILKDATDPYEAKAIGDFLVSAVLDEVSVSVLGMVEELKRREEREKTQAAVPQAGKDEWYFQVAKEFAESYRFDSTKKIAVIKHVRTLTGLGLKEAKEVVDRLPFHSL